MGSIVDLPVEIILAIIRQLRDENYNLHLRQLSLANKFLRDVTNLHQKTGFGSGPTAFLRELRELPTTRVARARILRSLGLLSYVLNMRYF